MREVPRRHRLCPSKLLCSASHHGQKRESVSVHKPNHATLAVQWLSHVQLFATPWTVARQASLSFNISWSFCKLMFIELVMPSNHLILCRPLLLLPSVVPRCFPMSQLFTSGGQSIGASASASVLPMNI